jgi:excinuclease UvrABC nuclease subunit
MQEIIQKYVDQLSNLMSIAPISFEDDLRRKIPSRGGIYRIFELATFKESIYVGETDNLQNRLYNNLLMGNAKAHTLRNKIIKETGFSNEEATQYMKKNHHIQYLEVQDSKERRLLKHFVISVLKPSFND